MRVEIRPEMLRWARERAGLGVDELVSKIARYAEWESGDVLPTMKQLEGFAGRTRTPIGYFFLDSPPEESLPIADFRTLRNQQSRRPSPDLLETIYICQHRQDWYRDHCLFEDYDPLPFIGSVTRRQSIEQVAASIRETINFDLDARHQCETWEEALRQFINYVDDAGIMVMRSGVVLNNNSRKLKFEEFRGFSLADNIAPLIFINGSDTKSAQMFTLAHELAHLWLGESALSTAHLDGGEDEQVERWCNEVAAETLVPLDDLRCQISADNHLDDAIIGKLSGRYKVSTLVVLRRLFDLEILTPAEFDDRYNTEWQHLMSLISKKSGGDFYLSLIARLSKRFACAIVESTLSGRTLYREAMKLVGVKNVDVFHTMGRDLGYSI